jgi:alpha-1,3/alpha-1,6-mannosyltransferase
VFYCHFPDKLLASGAFVEGDLVFKRQSLVKRLYRLPMDWLEEVTTREWCNNADIQTTDFE